MLSIRMATADVMTEPPADLATEASDLRIATFRLARRLRQERALEAMSDGQFSVLAILYTHGTQASGELAERERVSAPAMTRTINCLEELGYLARTPDEDDRRRVNVSLTDAGTALVTETTRRRDTWLQNTLAELSDEQRATLTAATEIMKELAAR